MKRICKSISLMTVLVMILSLFPMIVSAASEKTEVIGKYYEYDKNSHYEFHEGGTFEQTTKENTYGTFYIRGNITAKGNKSGVPSYEVLDEKLSFFYNYGDAKLKANEDAWHLVNDESDEVSDKKLDADIMKGAIILQTSKDRKNWVDVKTIYNAFGDTSIRTNSIYSATEVELNNGCFYRVVVVYKLSIRTEDSNFLFINTDKYDYKKCAEIYEFYVKAKIEADDIAAPGDGYRLGDKVRVEKHDGYFGQKEIEKGDLHYGDNGEWNLGNFFVSGHTDEVVESNGNVIFLKNVGDKVTLWFNLEQNIDALDGNEKLSITSDEKGHDQYFGTGTMDFGRGTLIVRKTDHNNNRSELQIYTNYLEANTSVGANTIVRLCEEGDYEVALDYEITSDELIDKIGHYRIFFTFSVRNSNCMVYPFDLATGSELKNGSISESGFRLDYANSLYLTVNVKREILTEGADGLIEDTRFNKSAKDGAEFTDEGIYTITVKNKYNGETTTKRIYVGTNSILRAHMVEGLSIPEINNLLAQGATINDDGFIQLAVSTPIEEPTEEPIEVEESTQESTTTLAASDVPANNEVSTDSAVDEPEENIFPLLVFIGIAACVLIVIGVTSVKKKKRSGDIMAEHSEEGDAE